MREEVFTEHTPNYRVQMFSDERPYWRDKERPYIKEGHAMNFFQRIIAGWGQGGDGIYARVIFTNENNEAKVIAGPDCDDPRK